MSDPTTTIVATGIICGIIIVGVLVLLISRFIFGKWSLSRSNYDERQKIARGKAYRDGYWTLLVAVCVMIALEKIGESMNAGFIDHMAEMYSLAVFLGIVVCIVSCVMRDAYIGLNDRARNLHAALALLVIANLLPAIVRMRVEFWDGWYNFLCAILFFIVLIVSVIKAFLDKHREAE